MAANKVDIFVEDILRRYVRSQDKFLDVGCGPAPYRNWVSGSYIGLDVTDKPYGTDLKRCVDVVGSAAILPFANESIDVVFSKSAFFLVPDPEAALVEFRRVLRSGGRLLLLDYNRRTQKRLMALDGSMLPCWTQWELKARLQEAHFGECKLLAPKAGHLGFVERTARLLHQELFGTWAIVTAVK